VHALHDVENNACNGPKRNWEGTCLRSSWSQRRLSVSRFAFEITVLLVGKICWSGHCSFAMRGCDECQCSWPFPLVFAIVQFTAQSSTLSSDRAVLVAPQIGVDSHCLTSCLTSQRIKRKVFRAAQPKWQRPTRVLYKYGADERRKRELTRTITATIAPPNSSPPGPH
jgi:hypothetical protein